MAASTPTAETGGLISCRQREFRLGSGRAARLRQMAEAQQVSTDYPFLAVRIRIRDWEQETLALVDTGFEGSLVIPFSSIDSGLGDPDASSDWILADGSVVESPVYVGSLEIKGLSAISDVVVSLLGSDYILGRNVLDRFELVLDHGQRLTIRP